MICSQCGEEMRQTGKNDRQLVAAARALQVALLD